MGDQKSLALSAQRCKNKKLDCVNINQRDVISSDWCVPNERTNEPSGHQKERERCVVLGVELGVLRSVF